MNDESLQQAWREGLALIAQVPDSLFAYDDIFHTSLCRVIAQDALLGCMFECNEDDAIVYAYIPEEILSGKQGLEGCAEAAKIGGDIKDRVIIHERASGGDKLLKAITGGPAASYSICKGVGAAVVTICRVCSSESKYSEPQLCGGCNKEGCEHCHTSGFCAECWESRPCCPKCDSDQQSVLSDVDDYNECVVHYEYKCKGCGHLWEKDYDMTDTSLCKQ